MGGKLAGCSTGFTSVEAAEVATKIVGSLATEGFISVPAGSLRRQRPIVNDVDIVVMVVNGHQEMRLMDMLQKWNVERWKMANWDLATGIADDSGRSQCSFAHPCGRIEQKIQVDLFVVRDMRIVGAQLQCWTGPYQHNVALRKWAQIQNVKVSQNGVFKNGKMIEAPTEADVYRAVGLPAIPVTKRDNFQTLDGLKVLREQVKKGDFES